VRAAVEGISDIKDTGTATSHFMKTGGVRYCRARSPDEPTFPFNNLISRAIIVIAGWRHEL
jgi:hypothetical protein